MLPLCGLAQHLTPLQALVVVPGHLSTSGSWHTLVLNQACQCASTADAQPASGLWFVML